MDRTQPRGDDPGDEPRYAPYVPTPPTEFDTDGPSESRTMSTVAFVCTGLSLLVPYAGILGVVFAVIALVRREVLARYALILAILVPLVSFLFWYVVLTGSL